MVKIKNGRKSPAIFETLHILMGNWFSSRLTASLGMSIKLLHAFTANSGISKKKKNTKNSNAKEVLTGMITTQDFIHRFKSYSNKSSLCDLVWE